MFFWIASFLATTHCYCSERHWLTPNFVSWLRQAAKPSGEERSNLEKHLADNL